MGWAALQILWRKTAEFAVKIVTAVLYPSLESPFIFDCTVPITMTFSDTKGTGATIGCA